MGRIENLKPFKPGDIGNPEGRNQYTYRRDFEVAIQELLKGVYEFRRELVEDNEGAKVHCILCGLKGCNIYVGHQLYAHKACVDQIDSLTRGQVIALVTVQRAMAGDEKMLPTVLDRLWPKVQKHEHEFTDDPAEADLEDTMAGIARGKRANGSGRGPQPSAAEDAGS